MSDASSTAAESRKMSPLMRVLVIIAVFVALLALVIMFVFASHQSSLQDAANNQTAAQARAAKAKNESTLGPIKVNKDSLYNRENDALGKSGPGPKSVIAGTTPGSLPSTSTSNQ